MQVLKFEALFLGRKAKARKKGKQVKLIQTLTQRVTVPCDKYQQKGPIYISLSPTITAEMYL